MKASVLAIAMTVTVLAAGGVRADAITECDFQAGHPSDPDHVGPGRSSDEFDNARAVAACREAVAAQPDKARFNYQLGRALVYQARKDGGDIAEGMGYLEKAAAAGYTQAQFVLGLMYLFGGETCKAEPLTRAAAGKGLKSARVSYVNNYLADRWAECTATASVPEMESYLEGARSQMAGWYEDMLLEALAREFSARHPK